MTISFTCHVRRTSDDWFCGRALFVLSFTLIFLVDLHRRKMEEARVRCLTMKGRVLIGAWLYAVLCRKSERVLLDYRGQDNIDLYRPC